MLQYGHIAAHLSSLGLQINNLTNRMPTLGGLVKKSIVCIFPQIKLFDQISHCMQSKRLHPSQIEGVYMTLIWDKSDRPGCS